MLQFNSVVLAAWLLGSWASTRRNSLAGPPLYITEGLLNGLRFTDDDIVNQERMSSWFSEAFHSAVRFDPEQWARVTKELQQFVDASTTTAPSLAFAVGSTLYSYFWWDNQNRPAVNVLAGQAAISLVHQSIQHRSCDVPTLSTDLFLERHCHARWRQLMLLSAELSRYLAVEAKDLVQAAQGLQETNLRFQVMRQLPFFQQFERLGAPFRCPHDLNYNMDYYPHVTVGPIWRKQDVPIADFLEAHYQDFRIDLLRIMEPTTFWNLHTQAFVSETQFTPRDEDWQTVYLFLNNKFVDRNCAVTPRSCELLRLRAEIAKCNATSVGAGFLRLQPGARLKPHYGNGPRLSVHLGLVVPDAGDIQMQVGTATVRWAEGEAVVFDDTFIHKVKHDGDEPRFVLLLWFCHPCDSDSWDNPPSRQPAVCHWPR